MSAGASSSGFRLAAGRVTAVLGPEAARRALLDRLDPGSAPNVLTVTSARRRSADERIAALEQAGGHRPAMVLVDRLTDGLDAGERRAVLAAVRALATSGAAVLLDDVDPVAALAVADGALRAGLDGSVTADDLAVPAGHPAVPRGPAGDQRAS
jgi:hypothetical protein